MDAERWLLLEEGDVLAGRWHDPASGSELISDFCQKWLEGRSPTVASKTEYQHHHEPRTRGPPNSTGRNPLIRA